MKYTVLLLFFISAIGFSQNNIDPLSFFNREVNTIVTDSIDTRFFDDYYVVRKTGLTFLNKALDRHYISFKKNNKINRVDLYFKTPYTLEFYKEMIKLYGEPLYIKKLKTEKIIDSEEDQGFTAISYKTEYKDCKLNENPEKILWDYKGKYILLIGSTNNISGSYTMNGEEIILTDYKLTFRNIPVKH
ncbi:hypothetical protein [Aquimarina aggregata]|uniref:hypothetical protein n=1 Tax=Aquimarina aggregata TaxID=1642818 RepID=UPI0024929BE1|nr:hypothetical protein [Aquimarina aggregata]